MKGAIGNALILNIVITFITIFLLLVVGSMAYTKAIKTKNYLLTEVNKYVENNYNSAVGYNNLPSSSYPTAIAKWDEIVNPYLAKSGYPLAISTNSCPYKNDRGYSIVVNTKVGRYDYCIYRKIDSSVGSPAVKSHLTYMVLVYMKFDFPVIGNYIKIPITGETKTYIEFK